MDRKLAALRAHDSQLGAWEGLEGFVVGMAEMIATSSGTGLKQAESFKAFFLE
jgi:LmbE family N-acetylglucosaminyl deacetylase